MAVLRNHCLDHRSVNRHSVVLTTTQVQISLWVHCHCKVMTMGVSALQVTFSWCWLKIYDPLSNPAFTAMLYGRIYSKHNVRDLSDDCEKCENSVLSISVSLIMLWKLGKFLGKSVLLSLQPCLLEFIMLPVIHPYVRSAKLLYLECTELHCQRKVSMPPQTANE